MPIGNRQRHLLMPLVKAFLATIRAGSYSPN